MRKITLNRKELEQTDTSAPAYGMRLEVTAADDMPREIFVKQIQNRAPTLDADFSCVATPAQLEDIVTTTTGSNNFYRDSIVELTAENPETLDAIEVTILQEIQLLINNLNALDIVTGEVVYQLDGSTIITL